MSREPDATSALFEQLRPRLRAISQRIVGSAAEAEDIVQDAFLKWHAADRDALTTPAAWLTTIVQHASIDRLRQRVRDAAAVRTACELLPDAEAAPPEDALLRRADLLDAMARLLAWLSPAERLALVLRDAFDCDYADIAAVLGTNPVNARQHLARARRRLRLREHAGETPPDEQRNRELVLRFQVAIDSIDVQAVMTLLTEAQPVAVRGARDARACANDAWFESLLAA